MHEQKRSRKFGQGHNYGDDYGNIYTYGGGIGDGHYGYGNGGLGGEGGYGYGYVNGYNHYYWNDSGIDDRYVHEGGGGEGCGCRSTFAWSI